VTHPIPVPRPSSDPLYRSLPRRRPLAGPFCASCTHPSCRRRRAACLPRLGGHRAEFAREHLRAASVQARHPHLVVWFGEATQSYWVADLTGLTQVTDIGALVLRAGSGRVGP
jgi:hypothetical protein